MPSSDGLRLYFTGPRQVAYETIAAVRPGPDEVLMRCVYSLISPGTELAMYTRSHITFSDPNPATARKYPIYPGYAAAGHVAAVGANVKDISPGENFYFRGKHQTFTTATPNDAALVPAPPDLPLTAAPFATFAQIAYTAVHVSSVQPGARVAVIGLGLIGNLAAQVFALEGTTVIGVDPLEFRRELGRMSGIEQLVDPAETPTANAVQQLTDGEGADIVVEATGDPALVTTALETVRPRGEVILLGSPRGPATIDVYRLVHCKGVTIKGAHGPQWFSAGGGPGSADRHSVTQRMIELLCGKQLKVGHLVSGIVAPRQAQEAYESLLGEKDKTLGILIDWSGAGPE